MRFDVLTLFPGIFEAMHQSVSGRALQSGIAEMHVHDLRDYSEDRSRKVDDEPYGGGAGMVISVVPVYHAVQNLRRMGPKGRKPIVVMMTPQGERWNQRMAEEFADAPWIVLLCGRYEGFDERVVTLGLIDREISLGDFVLGGGEVAAMAVMESILRLVPGVVGNRESVEQDSHTTGLLDYPHYTRPASFLGEDVPPVLLSGDGEAVTCWRRRMALRRTWELRPDLLEDARLTRDERQMIRQWEDEARGDEG